MTNAITIIKIGDKFGGDYRYFINGVERTEPEMTNETGYIFEVACRGKKMTCVDIEEVIEWIREHEYDIDELFDGVSDHTDFKGLTDALRKHFKEKEGEK